MSDHSDHEPRHGIPYIKRNEKGIAGKSNRYLHRFVDSISSGVRVPYLCQSVRSQRMHCIESL
jgi:hypothetical protein